MLPDDADEPQNARGQVVLRDGLVADQVVGAQQDAHKVQRRIFRQGMDQGGLAVAAVSAGIVVNGGAAVEAAFDYVIAFAQSLAHDRRPAVVGVIPTSRRLAVGPAADAAVSVGITVA